MMSFEPFRYLFAIVLPCVAVAGLAGTAMAQEDSSAQPAKAPPTIVVLGDSLAAGNGVERSEAFPAVLQEKIRIEGWSFNVINAGVSGDTSAGGLRRLDWVLRQRIDVLLLELGANDGLRGIAPEATKQNLQAIIDRTKSAYPDAAIVIAGMRMPPNMGADYTKRFENVFIELAKENNAALIPFLLEGVGGRPEYNQSDRIHPTPAGHRIIAGNVWKVLHPLLQKMQERRSGP